MKRHRQPYTRRPSVRALRLNSWKSEPELVDVARPEPGPADAVIKVGGAGACHSDLHLMHDFDESAGLPWAPPFTLGHENAGWVDELGSEVSGFEVGQAVGVYGAWVILSAYVIILGISFLIRFLAGKWKSMRVIEHYEPTIPLSYPEIPTAEADL